MSSATGTTDRRARVTWRQAAVKEVIDETARARTLVLHVPDWPGHRAGQHIDLRLTAEDGYQAQRSYSIASPPEWPDVSLTIDRVDDGEVSPYLVDEVVVGDELELRGPVGGHFTWSVEDGGPLVLLAGGSGLVPLMAMLRHRSARASSVETRLLVSVRAPGDLLFARELVDGDGLEVAVTYTRASPPDWTGRRGRLDAPMLHALGAPLESTCFVCGPTPFVEAAATLLLDAGYDRRRIHTERFGPS